jgi:hypothetical protein
MSSHERVSFDDNLILLPIIIILCHLVLMNDFTLVSRKLLRKQIKRNKKKIDDVSLDMLNNLISNLNPETSRLNVSLSSPNPPNLIHNPISRIN